MNAHRTMLAALPVTLAASGCAGGSTIGSAPSTVPDGRPRAGHSAGRGRARYDDPGRLGTGQPGTGQPGTGRPTLVQVGANASGVNLGVQGHDDDGCLFRFGDGEGSDLVLPVHDSIGIKSGVLCDQLDGFEYLARLEASPDTPTMYDASVTRLDRVSTSLVPGASNTFDIDADAQAGWLAQFGDVNCDGFEL